jgi:hypothetical protein
VSTFPSEVSGRGRPGAATLIVHFDLGRYEHGDSEVAAVERAQCANSQTHRTFRLLTELPDS